MFFHIFQQGDFQSPFGDSPGSGLTFSSLIRIWAAVFSVCTALNLMVPLAWATGQACVGGVVASASSLYWIHHIGLKSCWLWLAQGALVAIGFATLVVGLVRMVY